LNNNQTKLSVKIANFVFFLAILISTFIFFYSLSKIYEYNFTSVNYYLVVSILACISSGFFYFGLKKINDDLKINLSLLFIISLITIYGFEVYLQSFFKIDPHIPPGLKEKKSRKQIANEHGLEYDSRTKIKVIKDYLNVGKVAYPNIHPHFLLKDNKTKNGFLSKNGLIFPLGGISNQLMIMGKESHYWMEYEGDKYGFHNENDVYDDDIDILLIGDSYAEGWCVKSEENISAYLNNYGYNVINFGKSGSGPLLEYAIFNEYAKSLKPKIILWLYYINDLNDLKNEMKSSFLKKYLNDDFSQGLINRQEEIDSVLTDYANQMMIKEHSKKHINNKHNPKYLNIFKLNKIRSLLNLKSRAGPSPIFKEILEKTKISSSGWGGDLYFVYLPAYSRYSLNEEHYLRTFILKTINELDIPIIDIHEEMFKSSPDPFSFFPFRLYGHYNSEGYKSVSDIINNRLINDQVFKK